ncbi:DNA-binding transcriptional LysR family regulator [Pseudomonas duriflava]|uniref:DNA-binding transcriptional LysR family regulator n=1 Tax=Pseudomonas duriflava TaxID=459528 RepID=A0A562Q772_9PSED|nr:LysR family transcriptional regulator [Pseudomonas duriflava]TWI52597.1 DNA-binding transcriptional LysR family regulator [Pseudomonas duriflava]
MDMRQLNYFIAVAEERHLGRAAERLHLSQPPLSRHIQALEAELGVQLFERTPKGMVLTQAGEVLLHDATNIRSLVKHAAQRAVRFGKGQVGLANVGVYGSSMFGPVPQVLARFRMTHPEVELALHPAQTPAQVLALRQGRVLLVFERLLPEETDIAVELVAREPLWLALNEDHPLAAYDRVDFLALRGQLLAVGSSPIATATAVDLCRRHGFEPRLTSPCTDIITATLQVAISSAMALVPESMTHVKFPGVVYRPLRVQGDAYMELHCFYLKNERSPLLSALLQTIREFRESAS